MQPAQAQRPRHAGVRQRRPHPTPVLVGEQHQRHVEVTRSAAVSVPDLMCCLPT
jgi:hypothetical protein